MTPSRRILVVGPSWVGDMVMAQSLFKALARRHPHCEIHVLAPAWSRPLLARMPEVAEAVDMSVGHGELGLGKRWRLARELRARHYDQAIVLPNSFKSALVPLWAGIPRRTGWLGEMRYGLLNDWRRLDRKRLPMTVQRFIALAADGKDSLPELESPHLEVRVSDVYAAMQALGLQKSARQRVLALCPGAEYGPAKRWPHYGELAEQMLEAGWAVWLFGSGKDRAVCAGVNAHTGGRCADLCGRTSLAQAVDLLSMADSVVSNDSGLMHVAAALDRPLVALYGSSDPGFTPPLNERSQVLSLGLECSPCFERECPLGHMDCLNRLSVESVRHCIAA